MRRSFYDTYLYTCTYIYLGERYFMTYTYIFGKEFLCYISTYICTHLFLAFSWYILTYIYILQGIFMSHIYMHFARQFYDSHIYIYILQGIFFLPTQHIYIFCLKGIFLCYHILNGIFYATYPTYNHTFFWKVFFYAICPYFIHIYFVFLKGIFLPRCKVSIMMQPKPSASLKENLTHMFSLLCIFTFKTKMLGFLGLSPIFGTLF